MNKKIKLIDPNLKKVSALSSSELSKVLGGGALQQGKSQDGIDCFSELASGGTTTDTYANNGQNGVIA